MGVSEDCNLAAWSGSPAGLPAPYEAVRTASLRSMPPEGTPSFRESYRAHVRERTLEAAYAETVEKGWERVRVGQVATKVGVSRALLYKEFGDKQGLGAALVLHESERFLI